MSDVLKCSSCQEPIDPPPGVVNYRCPHCGVLVKVKRPKNPPKCLRRRKPIKARSGKQKRKGWQSEAYREEIRSQDCCSCGRHGPNQAHHVEELARVGTDKDNLVPLCAGCHDKVHQAGSWGNLGITKAEALELAAELTEAWLIERSRERLDVPAEWRPDDHLMNIGATLEYLRAEGFDEKAARVKYDAAGLVRSIAGLPLVKWRRGMVLEAETKGAAFLLRQLGLEGYSQAEAWVGMSETKYGEVAFWRRVSTARLLGKTF